MGLDYRFVYVAPRAAASLLLDTVADRVTGPHARQLRASLPWSPASPASRTTADAGIRGLRPFGFGTPRQEIPGRYDLSFLYRLDAALEEYIASRNVVRSEHVRAGKLRVGAVYMELVAGDELLLLTFSAATTDMSLALAHSESVRKTMASIALDARANAIFLDREDVASWDMLVPGGLCESVPRPRRSRFTSNADVDEHCAEALALAERPRRSKNKSAFTRPALELTLALNAGDGQRLSRMITAATRGPRIRELAARADGDHPAHDKALLSASRVLLADPDSLRPLLAALTIAAVRTRHSEAPDEARRADEILATLRPLVARHPDDAARISSAAARRVESGALREASDLLDVALACNSLPPSDEARARQLLRACSASD